MIKDLTDFDRTAQYIYDFICNNLHEECFLEDIRVMLSDMINNDNSFVYELYSQDFLTGVVIGSHYESEVMIDYIYSTNKTSIEEFLDFIIKKYPAIPITYYFHKNEENFYQVFTEKKATFETISYVLNYNAYLIQNKIDHDFLSVLKYEPKYHKIVDKMSPADKVDLDMVYVVLRKKKPIGYIEVSLFEDGHVYIEHLNILPKYEDTNAANLLVQYISKLYIDYPIDVILSAYDDEKLNWYLSHGFEMEEGKTFIEAFLNQ